jgi:hypothetical protein
VGEGHEAVGVDREAALLGRLAGGRTLPGGLVLEVGPGRAVRFLDPSAGEHPHPAEGDLRRPVEHEHLELCT